jgi:hypothetical protein
VQGKDNTVWVFYCLHVIAISRAIGIPGAGAWRRKRRGTPSPVRNRTCQEAFKVSAPFLRGLVLALMTAKE